MKRRPPASPGRGARPASRASRAGGGSEQRTSPLVLVVDDVADNREIYCGYLVKNGYRVVEASDGEVAVAFVADLSPDIVVMDLAMPFVDGWEATRRIRALPNGGEPYVIVLTAHVTREAREEAIAAGCDEFIAKPCLPIDLERRIAAVLADRDGT